MNGAMVRLEANECMPDSALLTLRRHDGVALVFVRDHRPEAMRRDARTKPIPGRLLLGMWEVCRSPDPLYEYDAFRANALRLLTHDPFRLLDLPVCSLLSRHSWRHGACTGPAPCTRVRWRQPVP